MKKLSKRGTTEVERTEYCWRKRHKKKSKLLPWQKKGGSIKLATTRRRRKIIHQPSTQYSASITLVIEIWSVLPLCFLQQKLETLIYIQVKVYIFLLEKPSHINFHSETLSIHNTKLIKIHINVLQKKKWPFIILMIVFVFIVVQPFNQF